jgi:N-acetylglucosamine-6-phosphate deacetylase
MDGTPEAFGIIGRCHASGGTTAFAGTTVTAPLQLLTQIMETAAVCIDQPIGGARLLGIHLEGPFLAPEQIGAHDMRYRLDPNDVDYQKLLTIGKGVRRMTLAPELPGAIQLITEAVANGWHVAMGHSDAHGEHISAALQAGCRHVTHLFSCTSGLLNKGGYKWPGINECALLYDEITVELIADGHHLSGELAALVASRKGLGRVCLVTDAMRAAGMPPGVYDLGSITVLVEEGVAKLPDRSKFAGSVATMNVLVRELASGGHCSVYEAIMAASATPARLVGVYDRKGSIEAGKDADVVVLSPLLEVLATVVAGKVEYQCDGCLAQA